MARTLRIPDPIVLVGPLTGVPLRHPTGQPRLPFTFLDLLDGIDPFWDGPLKEVRGLVKLALIHDQKTVELTEYDWTALNLVAKESNLTKLDPAIRSVSNQYRSFFEAIRSAPLT